MNIQKKIAIYSAAPFFLALCLASSIVWKKYLELQATHLLSKSISQASIASDLVTSLQKERGLTSMYLGNNNAQGKEEMLQQRTISGQLIASYQSFLEQESGRKPRDDAFSGLTHDLTQLRDLIDGEKIGRLDTLQSYTKIVRKVLQLVMMAINSETIENLGKKLTNVIILLEAQENTALLRGALAGTFAADVPINLEQVLASLALNIGIIDNLKSPVMSLGPGEQTTLNAILSSDSWIFLQKATQSLLQNFGRGNFGINSAQFFAEATSVISEIINLQQREKVATIQTIQQLNVEKTLEIKIYLAVFVIFTVILTFALWIFARKLNLFAASLIKSNKVVLTATSKTVSDNKNLAVRTGEQAASLEETSATLEEITATVKQTADNSTNANSMTNKVVDLTATGLDLAIQTRSAMLEISDSSKKISEIITLIDDIAFQTNILAINAAIEAAKAGDQGKGFAVVAIEVRDLAQKVVEATKDIKTLINSTQQKVKRGENLVESSNQQLQEVSDGIRSVADIIGEISNATKEQSIAVEQINIAVSQLDNVTQKNSAMVEEINAASHQMLVEVQSMNEMINLHFGKAKQVAVAEEEEDQIHQVDRWRTEKAPAEKLSNLS